jgi:hypothetical protein
VTRRRGRRRKKLLDDLGDRKGHSHLKEEALDRTKCTNRFGRGLDLSSDGLLMMIPLFDRHQDTDNVRNSEATTRRKHNTQTPSETTGTIPQESKVLLIIINFKYLTNY